MNTMKQASVLVQGNSKLFKSSVAVANFVRPLSDSATNFNSISTQRDRPFPKLIFPISVTDPPRPVGPVSSNSVVAPLAVQKTTSAAQPDAELSMTETIAPLSETGLQSSPQELKYTGHAAMPITSALHIVKPHEDAPTGIWPVFRLMDTNGAFRSGQNDGYKWDLSTASAGEGSSTAISKDLREKIHPLNDLRNSLCERYPTLSSNFNACRLLAPANYPFEDVGHDNTVMRAFQQMIRLREMDAILQNAQRQGRISFYMACQGEEAIHFGAASALELEDTVLAQYREAGLLMYRNFSLQQFLDQCFSNKDDLGHGRQMPVHYGSRALNYQTISSPLGTQIPQAAGAAYRLKLQKKDAVAVCFFGDGCASTTDFHSGLNFAATLGCPVIFFCRNNGYAISTKVSEQYSGDGIVSRSTGYGMAGIRVDGNDIFAVHAAVREARAYALENSAPVLIEAMTYRVGHHSTSDDSLRYRSSEEVQSFKTLSDPVSRLQAFLQTNEMVSDQDVADMRDQERMAVIEAMRQAEEKAKPSLDHMFSDVYHSVPRSLQRQEEGLRLHRSKHPSY